jgi:erythronate-4-phosphate dehydrogenase
VTMKIVADANIPFVKECFSSFGEVEVVEGREITADVVRKADILLVRSVTKVDSKLLEGSGIRFVGTATIGFEHVDINYLRSRGIGFASAPGSNANSVAEYLIAGLLEVGQKYGINLEGSSIGIIGIGNVGGKVVDKCAAIGMKVYLNDPPLQRQSGGSKYRPIEELLGCDFITLHVPLTGGGVDKTFHLADDKFFKSLKKDCVFINTARGAVTDTAALKAVIRSGKLRAAIIDVWENEPEIDTGLLEMIEIGTPHIAGYSLDGKVTGMGMIYMAACKYFAVAPKVNIESFMPAAEVGRLKIDVKNGDEQQLLLAAVKAVYDIRKDDSALKAILGMPSGERRAAFDRLRSDYYFRREFGNTHIVLENENKNLCNKLKGIGFKI